MDRPNCSEVADKEGVELGSPISFIDAEEKQEEKPGNYCILVGWLLLPRDCAHRGGTGSCRLRLRMCFTVKNLFGHSWIKSDLVGKRG